jgi:ADP-ribosyl-[dinitrogen reductase] hydrolase
MEGIVLNIRKRDKIAGAIYGFAIGDAMGATTEFMSRVQIERNYGKVTDIVGGGWLNLKPGEVTDDTQMSICVMSALMNTLKRKDPLGFLFMKQLRKEFIEWYRSRPKDVGGQCQRAIQEMIHLNRLGAKEDENALGNGSLMRAMPCALLDKELLNSLQGRMTHNNSPCTRIIQSYSGVIQCYLNDKPIGIESKRLLEPSGHVKNTFDNSLYWSQRKTFKEAILGAVNDGGDADTIAAITGSIAGAKFGYDAIPKEWVEQLDPDVENVLKIFKNFAFTYLQI